VLLAVVGRVGGPKASTQRWRTGGQLLKKDPIGLENSLALDNKYGSAPLVFENEVYETDLPVRGFPTVLPIDNFPLELIRSILDQPIDGQLQREAGLVYELREICIGAHLSSL